MKKTTLIKSVCIAGMAIALSCSSDESPEREIPERATPEAFAQLKSTSLGNKIQNFQLDAAQTGFFSTENGVFLTINGNCLSKNGNPVTGMLDVQVVELFERGAMLITNKPTMGTLPNVDSVEVAIQNGNQGERFFVVPFGDFGWTNVDRFFSDPRPKTSILVEVPEGFNDENSRVYLSYLGEPNALAYLDTYDSVTGLFSEHYGQIPIGLECHEIFISEDNGLWLNAIKTVTIALSDTDLNSASESELEALINTLS